MAEQIGSIEYDVSVNDINAQKVLQQVAKEIENVTNTAKDASKAIDTAAGEITDAAEETVDAVKDVAKETDKVSDAAKTAASAEEKLADTLADTAAAADDAATAQEQFSESIDTANAEALNDALAEVVENTEKLNETTAEATAAATDFANELYALTVQTLDLIKNGETESDLYSELKDKITDLLNANKDYANNPPFTEEQSESLREYKDELIALYDELNAADTVEQTAAEIVDAVADAAEDAAENTETLTKTTKANAAAAKDSGTIWNYLGKLFKVKLPAGATAAKFAIESLKMAISAGLLTVITMLSEAIMKLVDKLTFGFRIQGELNKQVADSTADAIANLKSLQGQWNKLGDDLSAKQKFILDNKGAFDKLGVSIKNVNEAERLLVTHTQQFISAIMARARASAAQGMIIKATQDSVEDLAEAENDIANAQEKAQRAQAAIEGYKQKAIDKYGRFVGGKGGTYSTEIYSQTQILHEAWKEEEEAVERRDKILKDLDEQTKGFQKIVVDSNAAADKLFRASGVDEAAALKNYKSMLDDRKAAYKDYASFLNSTNAEVRANAADIADVNTAEGKTYLQWLMNEKKRLESAIADPNAPELDINKNKYNLLMKEIAAQTQLDKKKKEELTYYEQLKALLKDYESAKGKGYYDPTIINNLKEQIRLYEERNHLVEPPTTDYSAKIAKYRDFAEKLVEIEQNKRAQLEKINHDTDLTDDQKSEQRAAITRLSDEDIQILSAEYGIYGNDLAQAVIDGMNATLEESEEDIVAKIIDLKQQIAAYTAEGSTTDNAEQVAKLSAQLQIAVAAYNQMKASATDTGKAAKQATDKITKPEAYALLKKSINDCAQSFKDIGQQIGGSTGEALEFVGDLTANIMGTITAIQAYAASTSKTIEGVGTATAAAIRTVEAASVILAIISAAMQVAMALVDMFKKDEETYEEKKQFYDAYIDTLDTLIERERKLTETLTAQDATAHFSKIKKYYEDKIKVEREAAKAYLESGASWRSHSEGYKLNIDFGQAEWYKIEEALKGIEGENIVKRSAGRRGGGYIEGDVYDILNLNAEQLKALQENAYEVYAKLPAEMRSAIDEIIAADEAIKQLEDDARAQRTGTSRETFVDALKESLLDLDVTAEKISENIHEYLRKGLVLEFYKSQMQADVNKYYEMWADAMDANSAGGSDITDIEQAALDAQEKLITSKLDGIDKINEKFRTAEEEEEEASGLSGAIKNASQESIDLLAGQTNAVRMNQVEGMALARESLDAVMAIHVQVTLCADYLRSINTAVNSPGSDRAQGII